jgi:hypothetical protein
MYRNHNPKSKYKIECEQQGPPTNAKVGSGAMEEEAPLLWEII